MKKISKLLVACMLHGAAFAVGNFEQKTFLLPHNPVHTQLLEQTMWRTHRHTAGLMQDGHVQVTGFYGQSMNRVALGKYFGIGNGKNSFLVGSQLDRVTGDPITTTELDGGYLIHDQAIAGATIVLMPASPDILNAGASLLGGKVTLNPRQTIYGANISYRQSMSGPFAGVFFQASMPIVQVVNNLGFTVENGTGVRLGTETFTLEQYFAGKVNVANGANAQASLAKGKMVAGERKATGLADINLQLGYKLLCDENTHFDVYLRGLVPTGNQSTGEYLFEPLVGNNNHFGIGAGVDGDATLWRRDGHRLSLQGSGQYTYVLEANEMRMAGITTRTDAGFKYNQYVAVAAPGTPLDPTKQPILAPAANSLAQKFSVRPGSHVELMTGLAFHSGGLSANVGYNLNWREQEKVYRKATDAFADSNVVVGKSATLDARVPAAVVGNRNLIGVFNSTNSVPVVAAAKAQTVVTAFDGGALQNAISDIGDGNVGGGGAIGGGAGAAYTQAEVVAKHVTGLGNNDQANIAAANTAGGNVVAGPQQQIRLEAYQSAAKLYAATGTDILKSTALLADAAHARADGAVLDINKARNLIQDLQRAKVSYEDSIRQESIITHVLGGSLGYSFEVQEGFPVMLGVGGQYELPHSTNAGLESYKLFCKLGISF